MKKGNYKIKWNKIAAEFFDKTGVSILDLIDQKLSNDQIKEQFKKLKLKSPSRAFLDYYRGAFDNKEELASEVNFQYREFLRSKTGATSLASEAVLDAIISAGFGKLKEKKTVNVQELIKAIELREKVKVDHPGDIQEQIDKIFAGEKVDKGRKEEKSVR